MFQYSSLNVCLAPNLLSSKKMLAEQFCSCSYKGEKKTRYFKMLHFESFDFKKTKQKLLMALCFSNSLQIKFALPIPSPQGFLWAKFRGPSKSQWPKGSPDVLQAHGCQLPFSKESLVRMRQQECLLHARTAATGHHEDSGSMSTGPGGLTRNP